MLKLLISITSVTVTLASVACDDCQPKKNLFNYIIKKQLDYITDIMINSETDHIHLDKMTFDIANEINGKGIYLYDITKLVYKNSYSWTMDENVIGTDINIGLNDMALDIDNLKYKDKQYINATVDVTKVFLQTFQIINLTRDHCDQKFEDFKVKPVEKAVLNNEEDITIEFNDIILPWVNQQLNTEEFQKVALKYFDECNFESMKNIIQLVNPTQT